MPLTTELIYWITERENMRIHKEAGLPYPHSKDPIMATTRFTNVRREDDKVTKWIAQHWRNEFAGHENLLVAMVLARMVNYIPSLEEIPFPTYWDPRKIQLILDRRKRDGQKVWSSAYTISTCGRSMDKITYVIYHVCDAVAKNQHFLLNKVTTLAEAHRSLMLVDGLGSFLAAQVIADLKHVPYHPLSYAPDFMTWAAHGPGSLKGLSEFYRYPVTPASFTTHLQKAYNMVRHAVPELSMQDFQNCMCEFSKYIRIKEGRGHARNGYSN